MHYANINYTSMNYIKKLGLLQLNQLPAIALLLFLCSTICACASAPKPAECHGDFKPINASQPVKKLAEVKCMMENPHG